MSDRCHTLRHMAANALSLPVIDSFRGDHYFLSNFYPAATPYNGHRFPTSEHAYMAARTTDLVSCAGNSLKI